MSLQRKKNLSVGCQVITRRTRLERSLKALKVSSDEEEAVYWFLTRIEWAQSGYRDPVKNTLPMIKQKEASPDELTWRFSRANTWAIIRSYYNKYGERNWNISIMMIIQQCSFSQVGIVYAEGKTYQYQSKKGKELCEIMIKNLTNWLSDYRKNRNAYKNTKKNLDGHVNSML